MRWATLIGILMGLASCQYQSKDLDPTLDGFFAEEGGRASTSARMAELQAASGARADAMLYKPHFDGPRLSSLGEEKLALMLKDDDSPVPLTVYLVLDPKDPLLKDRQNSVAAFLKDKGLKAEQISMRVGDNPDSRTPAAPLVGQAQKMEAGSGVEGKESGGRPTGPANGRPASFK